MNITETLRRLAVTAPESVAMIRPDNTRLTFQALDKRIDRCARRVLGFGLRPGQIASLAIGGPDESLALILTLALARAGIASADPKVPASHLAAVLVQQGAMLPQSDVPAIAFGPNWTEDDSDTDTRPVAIHMDEAALFRVFSTSGTTGTSRHCPITHAMMAARLAITDLPMNRPEGPPVLISALGGTGGLHSLLTTLNAGGTLVFTSPSQVVNAILRFGVTTLRASPFTMQQIVATMPPGIGPLPSLRAVITGGSPLPGPLAQKVARRLCPNVMTRFGATETGGVAIGRLAALGPIPFGFAAGEVIPEAEVQAVNGNDTPLASGVEGELRLRAPGMASHYLDDAEATAECFRDGWFYPGDRGLVTANRVLVVTGRSRELINVGGVKISPRTIEATLLDFPGMTEVAAFAVPDTDGLAQIWVLVVGEGPLDVQQCLRFGREKLGPSAPRHMVQVLELPRNANGKVMTEALVAFALQRTRPGPGGAGAPRR